MLTCKILLGRNKKSYLGFHSDRKSTSYLFSENSIGSRDLNFDGRFKIFDKGLQGTKVKGPVTFHFGSGYFREIQTTLMGTFSGTTIFQLPSLKKWSLVQNGSLSLRNFLIDTAYRYSQKYFEWSNSFLDIMTSFYAKIMNDL